MSGKQYMTLVVNQLLAEKMQQLQKNAKSLRKQGVRMPGRLALKAAA
jgi:hypothetical protein